MAKKKPNIRFKGFDEEWESKTLGNMGNTFNGLSGKSKKDFGHGDAQYITYMNVFSNPIASPDGVDSVEIDPSQNAVQKGDILFTTSSETPDEVGMSSVWLGEKEHTYLNSFCFGYRPTEPLDPYFSAFLMRSPKMREAFHFLAQGISRFNISKQKAMDIETTIPQESEQKKIGEFFKQLDELICAKEQELEKLRQIKAALLDAMFPSEDAQDSNRGGNSLIINELLNNADLVMTESMPNTPRIRFRGFTKPWEKKSIGDVVRCPLDYGLNAAATKYDGRRKYIRITDIDDTMRIFNYDDLTSPNLSSITENYKLKEGDIVFARTGASVGKSYLYRDKDGEVYFAGFLIRARIKDTYSPYFVFTSTLTDEFSRFIKLTSQRTGQPGVNAQEYERFSFLVPQSYNEQHKIGNFFRSQDENINNAQQQINKLRTLKQAFLQGMFAA